MAFGSKGGEGDCLNCDPWQASVHENRKAFLRGWSSANRQLKWRWLHGWWQESPVFLQAHAFDACSARGHRIHCAIGSPGGPMREDEDP